MLVVLNVGSYSNGVCVHWCLDVHLQLSAMGGACLLSSAQPWMLSGILLPGVSAQGLLHHYSLARATESGIYWGWHSPKGHQAVWPPFRNFSFSSMCLWLLLDAAQGIDILISGMDSRSFLITAVERKREILFSVLFNQFIQMLWPTGCYFSCLGTWTFLMQSFMSETDKPLASRTAQGHRLTATELSYPKQAAL